MTSISNLSLGAQYNRSAPTSSNHYSHESANEPPNSHLRLSDEEPTLVIVPVELFAVPNAGEASRPDLLFTRQNAP
jgi:hypothetical protein